MLIRLPLVLENEFDLKDNELVGGVNKTRTANIKHNIGARFLEVTDARCVTEGLK